MATKDSNKNASKSDERNIVGPSQVDIQDIENEVIMLWQKNKGLILGGVAAIFVIFLGYNVFVFLQNRAEEKLQIGYQAANTEAAKLDWAESNSGSELAAFAFKELGDSAFETGDYAKAESLYRKAAESAESVVKEAATMSLAATLVELSKTAEAKDIYKTIAADADSAARAEAQFRLGQLAHKEGDADTAKSYLEAIGDEGGVWKQRAVALLEEIS